MAIRNWHPGKLVLIWLVCLAIAIPLFAWVFESGLIILPPEGSVEYTRVVEDLRREREAKLLGLIAATALTAIPLVSTWVWFSGRERRGSDAVR